MRPVVGLPRCLRAVHRRRAEQMRGGTCFDQYIRLIAKPGGRIQWTFGVVHERQPLPAPLASNRATCNVPVSSRSRFARGFFGIEATLWKQICRRTRICRRRPCTRRPGRRAQRRVLAPSWAKRPSAVRLTGARCGSRGSISTIQPNRNGSPRLLRQIESRMHVLPAIQRVRLPHAPVSMRVDDDAHRHRDARADLRCCRSSPGCSLRR